MIFSTQIKDFWDSTGPVGGLRGEKKALVKTS